VCGCRESAGHSRISMSDSGSSDDENDVSGADLDALISLEAALTKDSRVYDTHVQVGAASLLASHIAASPAHAVVPNGVMGGHLHTYSNGGGGQGAADQRGLRDGAVWVAGACSDSGDDVGGS
jgi:hypothetical protein